MRWYHWVAIVATGGIAFYFIMSAKAKAGFRFDFGTDVSPVESGYTQVTAKTLYRPDVGYGWTSISGLDERDRPTDPILPPKGPYNNLTRDFVQGTVPATFRIDLPNGTYKCMVTTGDPSYAHDKIAINIPEGQIVYIEHIDVAQYIDSVFNATVTNGHLDLTISLGGTGTWVLNALTVA